MRANNNGAMMTGLVLAAMGITKAGKRETSFVKPVREEPISFKVNKLEELVIRKIADRAQVMAEKAKVEHSEQDFMMDITACHANGCPLRLQELLAASKMDFAHDLFGIRKHLNRRTGKLTGGFVPRFKAPVEA